MATIIKKGKATVEGTAGTFDVILYPLAQTIRASQAAEEEVVKDVRGFDAAWLWRNEHNTYDVGCKIVGDTVAHAKAGGAFLDLGSKVTISASDLTELDGDYQVIPGADIDLGNTKVGDITFKLRKYADATQQTAATTTPS